jgi:hypothetical protein
MKYAYIAVTALFMAASPSAFAQSERMNDVSFITASRCVAYAELPQLSADVYDFSTLKTAVADQSVNPEIRRRAREAERNAHLAGLRAGDDARAVEGLRNRRDDACASFVSSGLVQAEAPTPAT